MTDPNKPATVAWQRAQDALQGLQARREHHQALHAAYLARAAQAAPYAATDPETEAEQ
jgi:hypothetical protein